MSGLCSRLARAARVLLLLIASVAFALAASELALRLAWPLVAPASGARAPEHGAPDPERTEARLPGRAEERRRDRGAQAGSGGDALPELHTLQDLARKNVRGRFHGAFYRTNRSGFRGPDYTWWPRPGVFRIAVTGDSYTMGSGVEEEDAYPAQLEALLDAGGGEYDYEVLNLGLAGINTRVAVNRLRRIGLRYHPDLAVYGFTVNDIEGPHYEELMTRAMRRELLERYRRLYESPLYLIRVAGPRLLTLWNVVVQGPGTHGYELRYNYFENEKAWNDLTRALDDLVSLGRRRRLCVHVLIHTQAVQLNGLHPFRDVYAKVARAARERRLTVTESFEAHRGLDPDSVRLSWVDTHPNRAGHALLARELLEDLRKLPKRCWAPHLRPALR